MMYPEILDAEEYRHQIDKVWPPIHNVIKSRMKQIHINEFNPIWCSAENNCMIAMNQSIGVAGRITFRSPCNNYQGHPVLKYVVNIKSRYTMMSSDEMISICVRFGMFHGHLLNNEKSISTRTFLQFNRQQLKTVT